MPIADDVGSSLTHSTYFHVVPTALATEKWEFEASDTSLSRCTSRLNLPSKPQSRHCEYKLTILGHHPILSLGSGSNEYSSLLLPPNGSLELDSVRQPRTQTVFTICTLQTAFQLPHCRSSSRLCETTQSPAKLQTSSNWVRSVRPTTIFENEFSEMLIHSCSPNNWSRLESVSTYSHYNSAVVGNLRLNFRGLPTNWRPALWDVLVVTFRLMSIHDGDEAGVQFAWDFSLLCLSHNDHGLVRYTRMATASAYERR